MKDVYLHNENLCSIAEIENTFSGRSFIREVLNKILPNTTLVIGQAQRPYYEPVLSIKSMNILSKFEKLDIDQDLFSLSFHYYTKERNDDFVQVFLDVWFEYEQPAFSFFLSGQEKQLYNCLAIYRRMSWKDITGLAPSYVLCKGIEEDIMWIGKSNILQFDCIIS